MGDNGKLKLWVVAGATQTATPKLVPEDGEPVGLFLRGLREQKSITVDEVASQIRIRNVYISAIEDDRYEALPGRAYALGFVRTYAEFLGANSAEVSRRAMKGIDALPKAPLKTKIPEVEREPRTAVAAAAGICIALAGYVYWYFDNNKSRFENAAETLAKLESPSFLDGPEPVRLTSDPYRPFPEIQPPSSPKIVALQLPTDVNRPVARPLPPSRQSSQSVVDNQIIRPSDLPAQGSLAEELPEPRLVAAQVVDNWSIPAPGPAMAAIGPSYTAAAPAAHTPPSLSTNAISSPEPASGMVQLVAAFDTWIEIRSVKTDKVLFSRVLRKGEVYRVPDRTGLTLTTGNAAGLEVHIDELLAPPLGTYGEVVRDLHLDAKELLASR
ncbi:MAG: helix-turn-helix domain-containing protein [Alphaproteobacteria bacterium]